MMRVTNQGRRPQDERQRLLRLYELYTDIIDPEPVGPRLVHPILARLAAHVASEFDVTVEAMKSNRRERQIAAARAAFCRQAYRMERYSAIQIGAAINCDHTTVLFYLRRLKRQQPSEAIEAVIAAHEQKGGKLVEEWRQ